HLVEHLHLELGVDVGQEDPLGVAEALGQARREGSEHAEPGLERVRGVEVVAVGAGPAEAFAGRLDQTAQVDAALDQEVERVDRVVAADHADELHGREQRGRGTEVDRRTTKRLVRSAEGRFDAVQGDATHHELTMPAVASRNSAIMWGARASAARSTTSGKRPSCLMMSCSAGWVRRPRSTPSAEMPAGSMPALRKMLDMRACAYWTL